MPLRPNQHIHLPTVVAPPITPQPVILTLRKQIRIRPRLIHSRVRPPVAIGAATAGVTRLLATSAVQKNRVRRMKSAHLYPPTVVTPLPLARPTSTRVVKARPRRRVAFVTPPQWVLAPVTAPIQVQLTKQPRRLLPTGAHFGYVGNNGLGNSVTPGSRIRPPQVVT